MNPDISPCLECPNHFSGIDKRLCLSGCLRLKAYRNNQDWTKEEVYIVPEGKDLVDDIGGDGVDPSDALDLEENDELEETEEIIDGDELPGPVKHIPPETSWKKTINPKMAEGSKKCAICGKPESNDNKFLRGVCRKPCYSRWYSGKVEHPVFGKFETYLRGSIKTLTPKQPKAESLADSDNDICLTTINIDLGQYPQIRKIIYRMAINLSLPVSHVAVTLLAEAIERRNPE